MQRQVALIVDDSGAARAHASAAVEETLAQLGWRFDVEEASSGVEALRLLAGDDVRVLVVDLHMPEMTGLEVLRFWTTRQRNDGVYRAVVVTTDPSARDREKARALGACAILEKPLAPEALLTALKGGAP